MILTTDCAPSLLLYVSELDARLRQLVMEACKHPPGSPNRQKNLTKIIRLASGKLWRESVAYYQDAVQQTWVYFCQHICERSTGEQYDPNRSSVITWLNYYLKRRLQDFYIEAQKQQAKTATGVRLTTRSGEDERLDPIDQLPARPDVPPILDEVRAWAMADRDGELRRTCIAGHPDVNCQMLILKRLPPETSWQDLSTQYGLAISTLSSFYQRQCLPRLRKFGASQGYI